METLNQTTALLIDVYNSQEEQFYKAVGDLKDEDRHSRMSDNTNHLAWLIGHIVSCRFMLCGMLGMEVKEPFPDLFQNTKGIQDVDYPSIKDLTKDMKGISKKLMTRLNEISDEELNAEGKHGRLRDFITFFASHESYHIGQIGMLRKFLGYTQLQKL